MKEMNIMLRCMIYSYLSPKRLIKELKINVITFDYIINMIKLKFKNSFIPVGEMVGAIAAQSIGEPATQMTLNTFHFAGVGSSQTLLWCPKIKELLHTSKNIKSPSVTIYLKENIVDRIKVQEVANRMELTVLRFSTSSSIYYDPSDKNTHIEDDDVFMDVYKVFNELNLLRKKMIINGFLD